MRLAVLLVLGLPLSLAACGDNLSVVVDVTHPVPVAKTVISVYESDSFDCANIEFGDVDPGALQAALVAEETHDATGKVTAGDLDGLSRTKDKSIVARGFDAMDDLVTAACATKGVVGGTDHVAITTEDALTISAVPEGDNPYTLALIATTSDGSPAKGRAMSWQVYAPSGTTPIAPESAETLEGSEWRPKGFSCTNANGVARVHPIPPNLLGGFATRIRASWAANTLPQQTALSKADLLPTVIHPPVDVKHPCAIRISGSSSTVPGTRKLVCLDGPQIALELTVTVGTGRATLTTTNTVGLAKAAISVLAMPGASPTDRDVYAVDASGGLTPLFGAAAVNPTVCPACANAVTDVLYVPACPDDPDAKLLLQLGATDLRLMNPRGGIPTPVGGFLLMDVNPLVKVDLNGAGCVTQVSPQTGNKVRQAVAVDATVRVTTMTDTFDVTTARGFYNCSGGQCNRLALPLSGSPVTFVESDQDEYRMAGISLDATGVVVSSWVVLPDPGNAVDRLVERDRVPAALVPNNLAAGHLDDDTGLDFVWNIEAKRGSSIELAYSRMAGNQRLEAVSAPLPVVNHDLLLDDLTGDGHPEVVLVGAVGMTGGAPVLVIPSHIPPMPVTIEADDKQCK